MNITDQAQQTQTLPTPWRIEKPGLSTGTYTVVVAADDTYVTADGSPETKARIVLCVNGCAALLEVAKAIAADAMVGRLTGTGTPLSGLQIERLNAAITFAETGEQ